MCHQKTKSVRVDATSEGKINQKGEVLSIRYRVHDGFVSWWSKQKKCTTVQTCQRMALQLHWLRVQQTSQLIHGEALIRPRFVKLIEFFDIHYENMVTR